MRTGFAQLPLHGGKAPAWLFSRMVKLSRELMGHVVAEYGPDDVLRRLSDPCWFQALGCVLGFDKTIEVLGAAVRRARVGHSEKVQALKRLAAFADSPGAGAAGRTA